MTYNLLHEPWIPVIRRSGAASWIAPWQIAETEDPAVRIETGRPDFDGSLVQFLIGLVQTAAAPKDKSEWRAGFRQPPAPQALREAFDAYAAAFALDGPGPRFLQDFSLDETKAAKTDMHEVGELFIDIPSHFIKEGRITALDLPSVAAALVTLQTNAPAGGRGNLTSLRGGGPLTTLIAGDDLWKTVWLNVLLAPEMLRLPGNPSRQALSDIFPWMAPTRTGDKPTTPEDVHPLQCFWGMPRRIRLDFSQNQTGVCSLSCRGPCRVVTRYCGRPLGVSYEGAFVHPLTPYSVLDPAEPPNPKKGCALTYRDWPSMVTGRTTNRTQRLPAKTVDLFLKERRDRLQADMRLWAFGYEMSNMKPVCWYAGTTPLLGIAEERMEDFRTHVAELVEASESVCHDLVSQTKNALFRRPDDAKGDLGYLNEQYYARTEADFFIAVSALRDGLESKSEAPSEALEAWLIALHGAAMQVFRANSQQSASLEAADLKRLANAHDALERATRPTNKKLRAKVGLAEQAPKAITP